MPRIKRANKIYRKSDKTYIYVIQNKKSLKVYVGKTNNPNRIWSEHLSSVKRIPLNKKSAKKSYINMSMVKNGIENYVFKVIEETDKQNEQELLDSWILYFKANIKNYGYNIRVGGKFATYTRRFPNLTKGKKRVGFKPRELTQEEKISAAKTRMKTFKITEEIILDIRNNKDRYKKRYFVNKYNISFDIVRRIQSNKTYTWVK